MQIKVNDYTNPDLSGIVNGQPNDATDVTNIFTSTNQVNDILDALSNNVQTTLTTTASITQNQDVNNIVNSSGGAFTITLPAGSGSYKPYHFVKISSDYNKVTIVTTGSDKIDNPFLPQAVPTGTSISLIIPGDKATVYWDGTYWRVAYSSFNLVTFSAYTTTSQTINGGSNTRLYFENENFDYGGFYTAGTTGTTSRFTPLVPGIYEITLRFRAVGAGPISINAEIYKNGSSIAVGTEDANTTLTVSGGFATVTTSMNGTTDYIEPYGRSPSTNTTIDTTGQLSSAFEAKLLYRT